MKIKKQDIKRNKDVNEGKKEEKLFIGGYEPRTSSPAVLSTFLTAACTSLVMQRLMRHQAKQSGLLCSLLEAGSSVTEPSRNIGPSSIVYSAESVRGGGG